MSDLVQEIEADGLGSLFAGGEVAAYYYMNDWFQIIPTSVWMGSHGKEIFDTGIINDQVCSNELSMWTNGENLTVYVDRRSVDRYLHPVDQPPPPMDDVPTKGQGGRPTLPWDDFFVEVIRLANLPDGLPDEQARLEEIMMDWCEQNWRGKGSISSIRPRLAKVYAALGTRTKT
ncbi:hypothetical protein MKL09_03685 [Methylobacterium sp. J-048]|uniref:hypothetical protein n=1 Tax=Methylobacterium sp. J-048 TaxID=2836635 RepID=UPI001FB9FEAB|nr:hypothetical protein [Methylobacterium sp. J-048]MCJ2055653.1 hypothetical protein [Methylobacterium sp. J-048]